MLEILKNLDFWNIILCFPFRMVSMGLKGVQEPRSIFSISEIVEKIANFVKCLKCVMAMQFHPPSFIFPLRPRTLWNCVEKKFRWISKHEPRFIIEIISESVFRNGKNRWKWRLRDDFSPPSAHFPSIFLFSRRILSGIISRRSLLCPKGCLPKSRS